MTRERVRRWRVGAVAATALVALGLLYASPLLLAATVVPLGYVAYGALSTVPPDAAVRVERSVDAGTLAPGERVTVTVTVENASEATLTDLRVVDGVPEELAVVEGAARAGAALRPGETATLSYDVVARRGEFAFDDPLVRLRSLAGTRVVTERVPAAGDRTLAAADPVTETPAATPALLRAGTQPTDSGGDGLAFRSTREYRPGDPINRVDWRRFARTRELTTISFREERSVRAVVVVDARSVGRVRSRPGVPTAAALCGYAAHRLYEALAAADAATSVAAIGVEAGASVPATADGVPWVPGSADDATARARAVFSAVQAVADGETDAQSPAAAAGSDPSGADSEDDGDGGDPLDGSASDGADETTAADSGRVAEATDGGTVARDSAAVGDEPDGAGATTPDDRSERVDRLLARFPSTARVVVVTPLLDEWPLSFVERVREREHPVTVVSPDATGDDSLGQSVVALERQRRLHDLSTAGTTAVDWDREEPIEAALADSLGALLGGGR